MFRKVLTLTAIVLVFSACQLQAAVIDSNWVSCDDGFWGDANNWDPNIVPDNNGTNTFAVTIDTRNCPDEVEVRLQQNRTIDRLDTYGEVDLDQRLREDLKDIVLRLAEDLDLTLTVKNGLTNHGFLEIQDLIIRGDVNNGTGAYLTGSGFDIYDGDLFNAVEGSVECEEYYLDVHDGNIFNYGNLVGGSPGGGAWAKQEFQNFGEVEIYGGLCSSDQAFTNESNGVIKGFGIVEGNQLIQNKGTICASAGSLLLRSNSSITNTGTLKNDVGATLHIQTSTADVNNQGIIEINASGAIVFDSNLVNVAGANIYLWGGTLAATLITQTADANFAGFGGITGNVVIQAGGEINLTGPTNIIGYVNIAVGATLEISDSTTLITGYTTNNGTIHMKGGRIIPQGGFTNNGSIIWEPGTYNNIADFNLDGQVNFKDFADFADTWLWQAQL